MNKQIVMWPYNDTTHSKNELLINSSSMDES